MIRRHLVVRGRVQGVFFRDSCRRQAERLGVAGAVWNRSDGAVGVEAEGEPAAVASLIAWCRIGPPSALVTDVEVEDMAPKGEQGFKIVSRRPLS